MQGIVRVRGLVQGVGFRPFVYRLAKELDLHGWVRNDSRGVEISVEGNESALSDFLCRLKSGSPAAVDEIEFEKVDSGKIARDFRIEESREGSAGAGIPPDFPVCAECLEELFDPSDRRYLHPFISCTRCGPRHTILNRLPYDRKHTSMERFILCGPCRREYSDPSDRRFHAQTNSCRDCGPRLSLFDAGGKPVAGDPVANSLDAMLSGKIVAVKGVGGFHLACDARSRDAVSRLREVKRRPEKPLALMAANCRSLSRLALIIEDERRLLESGERPIVLLRKRGELEGIAPGVACFGAMLPYAALHYLLFHEAAGSPSGTSWLDEEQELLLVMTSANFGGEPIAKGYEEAFSGAGADLFLDHDREILVRCDDSVMRWNGNAPQFVRRSRGYAPAALKLPFPGSSVLAFGSGYKNTFCLTRGDAAFLSQHVGDLGSAASRQAMDEAVEHLERVLGIEPEIVAHDLHPDFHSTRLALGYAERRGIPAVGIQHHHAHVCAVMAEHGITGAVVGLALDGVGLGADNGTWGGELLLADECGGFSRIGHFRALPGGDAASREPWRMAASALYSLGRKDEISARYGRRGEIVRTMLERNLNMPETSSAGRLFDAAAGLLGVIDATSYEGQAAMLLEALALEHGPVAPLEEGFAVEAGVLDFLPLLGVLSGTGDPGYGAALFHATLVKGLEHWVCALSGSISRVVFSGGCFMNTLLSRELGMRLERRGYAVFQAEKIPPNDGGISLGQAYAVLGREAACA